MNLRFRRNFLSLALLAFAALDTAGTLHAGAESAKGDGVDLAKMKTYHWKSEKGPQTGDLDKKLRAAADEQLAKKGLKLVPTAEPADMELRYNAGTVDILVAGLDVAAGYWGDLVGVPGTDSNVRGGMIFMFEDPANGKTLWAGWIVKEGTTMNAAQVMRKRAPKWAGQILSRYPK